MYFIKVLSLTNDISKLSVSISNSHFISIHDFKLVEITLLTTSLKISLIVYSTD
jgi:hypothetical protein